jgi:polysaccharide export outer membrane protein
VLQIDLIAAVPKPPYKLKPLDAVSLKATGVLPDAPIQGVYQIDTDGTINLGAAYGAPVPVVGLTVPEAKNAIMEVLKKTAIAPTLEMALAQSRGMQQVRGPHLVRPDGTVWFDIYGGVRVVGLTVPQARKAIEEHLSQFFLDPEVALNVTGYNSKVYYVCFDSGFNGAGTIIRQPVTGNETVLDVISGVGGLSAIADYKRIWIARPGPAGCPPQLLPIDWRAITEFADPSTNYQILPGDRIFVKAAPMPSFGARMDRVLAPIERLFGFILLGIGTYQNIRFINQGGFGFGGFPAPPVIQ